MESCRFNDICEHTLLKCTSNLYKYYSSVINEIYINIEIDHYRLKENRKEKVLKLNWQMVQFYNCLLTNISNVNYEQRTEYLEHIYWNKECKSLKTQKTEITMQLIM